MPTLSVIAIRAALVHLALGFTFGGLMLSQKGIGWFPAAWRLLPAHVEILLLGWMAQLAIGVGYWILPRFGGKRGNVKLAWAAVIALNLGVIVTALRPILGLPPAATAVGRGLSTAAVVAFIVHAWPRVKAPGA
ncbi:MAG: hypothetical protein WBR18_02950 [Anaerolineales bacterium]